MCIYSVYSKYRLPLHWLSVDEGGSYLVSIQILYIKFCFQITNKQHVKSKYVLKKASTAHSKNLHLLSTSWGHLITLVKPQSLSHQSINEPICLNLGRKTCLKVTLTDFAICFCTAAMTCIVTITPSVPLEWVCALFLTPYSCCSLRNIASVSLSKI